MGRRMPALALAAGVSCVLWLLLVGLAARPGQVQAQGAEACDAPGTLRIVPAGALVNVSRAVTVEVWLEDAGNYYGLDLRLAFDPALVQVPAGRVTPLWEVLDSSNHFIIKNEANNISGTVWYAVTNMNPAEPFTGTGRICTIALTGLVSGTTPLRFTYTKGSTRNGEGLYPATVDGSITVQAPERHVVALPLILRYAATPQSRGLLLAIDARPAMRHYGEQSVKGR